MKKIIYSAVVFCAVLLAFASCNLDRFPSGAKQQQDFKSAQDAKLFRESLYSLMRSAESPSNLRTADIMADLYNVPVSDGNVLTPFGAWVETALENNDNVAGYYSAFYRIIMQANYFIEHSQTLLDKAQAKEIKMTGSEKEAVKEYIAEAKVMKAQSYYRLMSRFARRYQDNPEGKDTGVVLLKEYNFRDYSPRASKKEVFDYCVQILDEAIEVLPDSYEGERQDGLPVYMVKDYAHAVKARVLTEMGKHKEAIAEINKFINKYPLTTVVDPSTIADPDAKAAQEKANLENLKKVYTYENSSEIMFKFYASSNIGITNGGLHGAYTRKNAQTGQIETKYKPSLYPNKWVVELYKDGDLRKGYYIRELTIETQPKSKGFFVTKFLGNPAFDTDAENLNFAVAVVPYRIAEAYLSLAENQVMDGDAAAAKTTLEKLRAARGIFTPIDNLSSDEMTQFVLEEKVRELIGEGFRMDDLKRHHLDMDRTGKEPQADVADKVKGEPALKKSKDDKMFIWEFPLRDRQANKNLKANWK